MRINLLDIPEDGKTFAWNRKTGEINRELEDLIGQTPYQTDFTIRKINSKDYHLTGFIKTAVPEQCSRCAMDFNFAVDQKLNEILIPAQPDDRTGKYAKVNHISEADTGGPTSSEYEDNGTFNVGEYMHEQVAIGLPFNPVPPEKANGDCSLCDKPVRDRLFKYDEEMPVETTHTPFEALKNFAVKDPGKNLKG